MSGQIIAVAVYLPFSMAVERTVLAVFSVELVFDTYVCFENVQKQIFSSFIR